MIKSLRKRIFRKDSPLNFTKLRLQFSDSIETNITPKDSKSDKEEKTLKTLNKEKIRNYKFSSYSILHLTQDIKHVREESLLDWLKIFLHSSMAIGFYATGYPYISPIFCWFASNSIVRRKISTIKIIIQSYNYFRFEYGSFLLSFLKY